MVDKVKICLSFFGVSKSDAPQNIYSRKFKYIQQLGMVDNQYIVLENYNANIDMNIKMKWRQDRLEFKVTTMRLKYKYWGYLHT